VFTPTAIVVDQNLPCDVVTFIFTWGDGSQPTQLVCNPVAPDPACSVKLGTQTIAATESHTYTAPGSFTVTVLVLNQGATAPSPIPQGVFGGSGWRLFTTQYVVFDPTAGYAHGTVALTSWVGKQPPPSNKRQVSGWVDLPADGTVQVTFSAKFDESNGTALHALGSLSLTWTGNPALYFTSSEVAHLTLFAPTSVGYAALFTGFGTFSLAPNIMMNFSVYAVDAHSMTGSTLGDYFHIIINDPTGVTVFDSAPGISITVLPTNRTASGSVTISNPPPVTVSAITQDEYNQQQNVIIGISILCGLLGMTVIVLIAIVAFWVVKRDKMAGKTVATKVPDNLGK